MTSRSKTTRRWVSALLALSVGAIACSSGDGDRQGSSQAPPTSGGAVTTTDGAEPDDTVERETGGTVGTVGADGLTPIERAGVSEDGAAPPPPDLRGLDDPEAGTEIRPDDVGITEADRCFGVQLTLDAVADGELELSADLLADVEAIMAECVASGFER